MICGFGGRCNSQVDAHDQAGERLDAIHVFDYPLLSGGWVVK